LKICATPAIRMSVRLSVTLVIYNMPQDMEQETH